MTVITFNTQKLCIFSIPQMKKANKIKIKLLNKMRLSMFAIKNNLMK